MEGGGGRMGRRMPSYCVCVYNSVVCAIVLRYRIVCARWYYMPTAYLYRVHLGL
jgi:hypothetical protein